MSLLEFSLADHHAGGLIRSDRYNLLQASGAKLLAAVSTKQNRAQLNADLIECLLEQKYVKQNLPFRNGGRQESRRLGVLQISR